MFSKLLVILLSFFVSLGIVYAYDSETKYKQAERDLRAADVQYQLDIIQLDLEQQRIQNQIDTVDNDCEYYFSR